MTERPMLFSGPMVRAILEGRKTQTRRILRVQPLEILTPRSRTARAIASVTRIWNGKRVWFCLTHRGATIEENRGTAFHCRYGEVGDRLWVRESHYVWRAGYSDGTRRHIVYRATEPDAPNTWTPSIHMPRWASRLTLEVTAVRVERLQQISEAGAEAEGIRPHGSMNYFAHNDRERSSRCFNHARDAYAETWDSLNAKRGHGWDTNPWVWVIEFRPLPQPAGNI